MNIRAEKVTELHRKAMELADESFVARLLGNRDEYLRLTELAFEKESAAAGLMADAEDIEPTRSVLHRSAASLAWRCAKYGEARKLIYRALAGDPPSYIIEELDDLLGNVKLSAAGQSLQKYEMQMSLEGSKVGHGLISMKELERRQATIPELVQIAVKSHVRRMKNFTEAKLKNIADIEPYVAGVTPGSFILTIRFGVSQQYELPGFNRFEDAVEPLFDNLRLLDDGRYYELEESIGDADDYRAFIKAAKPLAPDGDRISSVKFQADAGDKLEIVSFRRTQDSFSDIPMPPEPKAEVDYRTTDDDISRTGILKVADALDETECVLVTDDDTKWELEGPEELMDGIVRTFFKRRVEVSGKRMRKTNLVNRIRLSARNDVKAVDYTDQPIP